MPGTCSISFSLLTQYKVLANNVSLISWLATVLLIKFSLISGLEMKKTAFVFPCVKLRFQKTMMDNPVVVNHMINVLCEN